MGTRESISQTYTPVFGKQYEHDQHRRRGRNRDPGSPKSISDRLDSKYRIASPSRSIEAVVGETAPIPRSRRRKTLGLRYLGRVRSAMENIQ